MKTVSSKYQRAPKWLRNLQHILRGN